MLVRIVYLFRSKNAKTLRFSFQHHTLLEQIWTLIPALILLFIAGPSFALLYGLDDLREPKVTVHAIGHQWFWHYEYPDYTSENWGVNKNKRIQFDSYMIAEEDLTLGGFRLLETDKQVVLPIKLEIRVLTSSDDVIHSWAVPSLGLKMDAIPGRLNHLTFILLKKGSYYGQCSELCGVGHSFMPIQVIGVSINEYTDWICSSNKNDVLVQAEPIRTNDLEGEVKGHAISNYTIWHFLKYEKSKFVDGNCIPKHSETLFKPKRFRTPTSQGCGQYSLWEYISGQYKLAQAVDEWEQSLNSMVREMQEQNVPFELNSPAWLNTPSYNTTPRSSSTVSLATLISSSMPATPSNSPQTPPDLANISDPRANNVDWNELPYCTAEDIYG